MYCKTKICKTAIRRHSNGDCFFLKNNSVKEKPQEMECFTFLRSEEAVPLGFFGGSTCFSFLQIPLTEEKNKKVKAKTTERS